MSYSIMRELIYTPTVRLSLWDITDGLYLDENTFENWLSGHLTVKCESLQTSQQRSIIPQHILTKTWLTTSNDHKTAKKGFILYNIHDSRRNLVTSPSYDLLQDLFRYTMHINFCIRFTLKLLLLKVRSNIFYFLF